MTETKYGKNIVTELRHPPYDKISPPWRPEEFHHMLYLDESVLAGAFYVECVWFLPSFDINDHSPEREIPLHTHVHDGVLAHFGTNMDDPYDLGAEIEIQLGDEKHVMTKSNIIFIPKGLKHGLNRINRIDQPVFHFACGTGKTHS